MAARRPQVQPDRSERVAGQPFAQDRHVRVRLRQAGLERLPRRPRIARPVDAQAAGHGRPHVAGFLRHDIGDVGVRRVHGECVPEAARQPRADVDPVLAAIIAAVHAAVVLLIETVRSRRMQQEPVHALAGFRVRVGKEVGPHSAVDRLPGGARIIAAVAAAGGNRAVASARLARIELDGAERERAAGGLPAGARVVVVERVDPLPGRTPVAGHEEPGRLDAGVQRVRLGCRPRRQVPDGGQAARVIVVGGALEHVPGRTAIVAAMHVCTPDGVVGGRPRGATVARVDPGVIHLAADQQRRGDAPRTAIVRARDEQGAPGTNADDDVAHRRLRLRRATALAGADANVIP